MGVGESMVVWRKKMPCCCQGSEVRSGGPIEDHRKARVIQKPAGCNPGLQNSNKKETRLHFRPDRFSVSLCTANKTAAPQSVGGKQIVPLKYTVLMRFLQESFFFFLSSRGNNCVPPSFRDLISARSSSRPILQKASRRSSTSHPSSSSTL